LQPETPYTRARDYINGFRLYSARTRTAYTVLRDLHLLGFAIERLRRNIVLQLRKEGASWREIGEALGVSDSAARHQYGGVDTPTPTRHS
jgi:hypothetical protein